MTRLRLLTPAFALALSACALPVIPENDDVPTPPARTESGAVSPTDADAPTRGTSDSTPVTQRLLPSGFIEIGAADAPVSLLLFTNHSCAYCKEFGDDLLPEVIRTYVREGKVRLTAAPFALRKYPQSERGALAQFCAGMQSKGMAMHDLLLNDGIDSQGYRDGLTALAIDQAALQSCMESPQSRAVIAAQQSFAHGLGVVSVPTYFINGDMFVGLPHRPDLIGQIEAALTE